MSEWSKKLCFFFTFVSNELAKPFKCKNPLAMRGKSVSRDSPPLYRVTHKCFLPKFKILMKKFFPGKECSELL